MTNWVVIALSCIVFKFSLYTSHFLSLRTIRHRRSLSWSFTCFFELKMKILAFNILTKRIWLQKIRTFELISKIWIWDCSIKSRNISIKKTKFSRRSSRCTVMKTWCVKKQKNVSKKKKRTWKFTKLTCEKVMIVRNIVTFDFLQKN